MQAGNSTTARLDDQIAWYDTKSGAAKKWYFSLKTIEILAAATIPLVAGLTLPSYIVGGLGVVVILIEGSHSLFQFHRNWLSYRSTCEQLKHEKYLWLANAGPYGGEDSIALLAERIEELISKEHSKWVSSRKSSKNKVQKDNN